MLTTLPDLSEGVDAFDEVIDVRSPGEFAEDHLPGAVNLPVLDDAERAEIGAIYVQRSKFEARRRGAAQIARNIAGHLEGAMKDRPGGWAPLLYCWRGGQRSHAMGLILSQVGWRTTLLEGGYRTYRRDVVARLYEAQPSLDVVLLDGPTGVGKTDMLQRLAQRGVQTLDLEALAGHRGSVFGHMGAQPSQKLFESRLAAAIADVDVHRPVVVEAESSRIGERFLPPVLWGAMRAGRRIELTAPLGYRVASLTRDYGALAQDGDGLAALLSRLPGRHGRARLDAWTRLAADGEIEALVEALVTEHYDPAYARARENRSQAVTAVVDVSTQGFDDAEAAAATIQAMISGASVSTGDTPPPSVRPDCGT